MPQNLTNYNLNSEMMFLANLNTATAKNVMKNTPIIWEIGQLPKIELRLLAYCLAVKIADAVGLAFSTALACVKLLAKFVKLLPKFEINGEIVLANAKTGAVGVAYSELPA